MKTLKTLFTFSLLLIFSFMIHSQDQVQGTSAAPYAIPYTQSDGSVIYLQGVGNPLVHYSLTVDDYTVVLNNQGLMEYAVRNRSGELEPSGVRANDPEKRTLQEITYLNQLPRKLYDSPAIRNERSRPSRYGDNNRAAFPSSGTRKAILLLIDYPDLEFSFDKGEFEDLMNQNNYEGTGSFRDFYMTSSYGDLTVNTDVFGWYTASNDFDYYADDNGRDVARELIQEAVDAAEAAGVDFSDYDNDNDGNVDGIIIVHAGPGAEEGSVTDKYIWSHRSGLNAYARNYDGVDINDYMINPEIRNLTQMVNIGIFCHEFGHGLGLPDLYDTSDPDDAEGIGWWGLMGSGNWIGGEATPAGFSAWSKIRLGWQTATDITGQVDGFSLDPASENESEVFRISTGDPNEYFLLENRQNVGLDVSLPGTGLQIWHIDDNQTTNSDETHKWVDLEEADGDNDLDNEVNRGDSGDLFPGSDNNTIFNDTSNPNSKDYSGSNTGTDINAIREEGITVFFNMGCEPPLAICEAALNVDLDINGQASISVGDVDNGSTYDCGLGSMSLSKSNFDCNDLGYNQVTLTVIDANGNPDECTTNVYIHDNMPPQLIVPADVDVDCWYSPTGPDATGYASATDNCDVNPEIDYDDVVLEFPDGSKKITRTWTAVDFEDNPISDVQIINVPSPMSVDAGEDQTIYVDFVGIEGYPYSACADLSSSASGGTPPYTYAWSNGMSGSNIEVCPDVCTQYIIEVTDANGCVMTDTLTIFAVIVECMDGNNQNLKYLICHNGETLCTSFSSTETHFEHGDALGACGDLGNQGCPDEIPESIAPISPDLVISDNESIILEPFSLFPNPAYDQINVEFELAKENQVRLILYSASGKVIKDLYIPGYKGQNIQSVNIQDLEAGIYQAILYENNQITGSQKFITLR